MLKASEQRLKSQIDDFKKVCSDFTSAGQPWTRFSNSEVKMHIIPFYCKYTGFMNQGKDLDQTIMTESKSKDEELQRLYDQIKNLNKVCDFKIS